MCAECGAIEQEEFIKQCCLCRTQICDFCYTDEQVFFTVPEKCTWKCIEPIYTHPEEPPRLKPTKTGCKCHPKVRKLYKKRDPDDLLLVCPSCITFHDPYSVRDSEVLEFVIRTTGEFDRSVKTAREYCRLAKKLRIEIVPDPAEQITEEITGDTTVETTKETE